MDHMSNYEEIKSSDNQPLPILKDPKGCLDLTKIHQKDDGVKEAVILLLQQDPKGCPDDVDIKKPAILQQDPTKGCQDIATNHLKDDIKKTNAFHQDDVIRDVILQEDFKGCQDDIAEDDLIEKHGLSKETLLLSGEICPSKSEVDQPADDDDDDDDDDDVDDDDDGFQTPTSLESRIPVMTECPPAPKKPRLATNRKDSSVVQQTATIRVIRVTRF